MHYGTLPTVAELANEAALLGLVVAAGVGGLGRQVSRIVRLSPDRLDASLHPGDLVLVSLAEWEADAPAAAAKLLGELSAYPIAAAVIASTSRETPTQSSTPMLLLRTGIEVEHMQGVLGRWLAERELAEERVARGLNEEFADLAGAGADTAEVVAHLARLTGKPALLCDSHGKIQDHHQPSSGVLTERELRAAVGARARSTVNSGMRQWRGVFADELPSLGLTRLTVALAWASESPEVRYLSLLGRPSAITQRDRAALAAAAFVLTHFERDHGIASFSEWPLTGHDASRFAVAMRLPSDVSADHLQRRLCELVGSRPADVHVTDGCLVAVLAVGSPPLQDWERDDLVRAWHARLSAEFGPISLGYSAVHTGPVGVRQSVRHARRALIAGSRCMGQGHACAYGDVSLRSFLTRTGPLPELYAMQEALLEPLIAHDRIEQVKLLPTLEIYLNSACVTKQTAERLGIHRNSVVYRLRRIESVAQVDLSDADTRLLLQLALRATRVLTMRGS